jgi:MFS family permease
MNFNLTDSAYEKIERLEGRKRLLNLAAIGCILAAFSGGAINVFLFLTFSHQKGGLSDNIFILFGILAIVCVCILVLGINRYLHMKRLDRTMNQIEQLEETIYNEVLKSRTN